MKLLSGCSRRVALLSLSAGTCFLCVQRVNANPSPIPLEEAERSESVQSADQLGGTQNIQGIRSASNTADQELPTFEIKGKSRPRGILGVLGGRFKDADRHPSFRTLEPQR